MTKKTKQKKTEPYEKKSKTWLVVFRTPIMFDD